MSKRPTLADVARAAGVGPATVDRVINGRSAVRPETTRRVFEAAQAIGYHGIRLLKRRLDEGVVQYRFGFLLQRSEQPFYQAFEAALRDACVQNSEELITGDVKFLRSQDPNEIVASLIALAQHSQAIAMVAVDHPSVTAAV